MRTINKTVACLIILFLAACGTAPTTGGGYTYLLTPAASPDVVVAQATYQAAVAAATNQASIPTMTAQAQNAAAAGTAAVATQQAGATADALSIQMTSQAISLQGTRAAQELSLTATAEAAALSATVTADANSAKATSSATDLIGTAEASLVADEANRLAIQRQAEAADVQRSQTWNRVWPWLAGVLSLAVLVVAGSLGFVFIRKSTPVVIRDNNEQPKLIIYGGGVQAIAGPARPQIAAQVASPAPPDKDMNPIELPALKVGHVLIAGETGSGKSTAMQAVLHRRQNVIVLDPHDTPGTWPNATVIGGGRNFAEIGQFIEQTSHLLDERYQQRASGVTNFPPLTVATDEMPAIVDELGKEIGAMWRKWLREGRKVSLFFVVSTQSTRVKTLGIEGESDLLENFAYVLALGRVATTEYPDLARGMERPAVIRTVHGARPVVIPYEDSPNAAALTAQTPLPETRPQSYTAPVPRPIVTDKYGTISPIEIMNVLRLKRAGESGRTIEQAVFGTPAGTSYYKVRAVLDAYSHLLQEA